MLAFFGAHPKGEQVVDLPDIEAHHHVRVDLLLAELVEREDEIKCAMGVHTVRRTNAVLHDSLVLLDQTRVLPGIRHLVKQLALQKFLGVKAVKVECLNVFLHPLQHFLAGRLTVFLGEARLKRLVFVADYVSIALRRVVAFFEVNPERAVLKYRDELVAVFAFCERLEPPDMGYALFLASR